MDISEAFAASGLNIGRYRQLIQQKKVSKYFKVEDISCPLPKVINV